MALASGHWVDKEVKGGAPSPRYGHALAVAGKVAFLFGGASSIIQQNNSCVYFNDLYVLTVDAEDVMWEEIPQNGAVPSAREGHSLCIVEGKLYLFGGLSHPDATECLPDVYSFDIVSLTWGCLATRGVALRTLRHSSVAVGDNIYVYGGHVGGNPTDNLLVFNTVSRTWVPVRTSGSPPPALSGQTWALVGDQVFMFGGFGSGGEFCKDLYVLDTENLFWQKWDVRGETPTASSGATLTAHHNKDIYLFGGKITDEDGEDTATNEIHKLSIANMKWKVPVYVGLPPARRHGHTAFILHSHLYVFGGKNEVQEFDDLKAMKLIKPSERQPVLTGVLSDSGLQGFHSHAPSAGHALNEPPPSNQSTQVSIYRDFTSVRDQALKMIQTAFNLLDREFSRLDRERLEVSRAAAALNREKEAHEALRRQQQQELKDMLMQNETWLRSTTEENDHERTKNEGGASGRAEQCPDEQ
ncbi:tip elongation aberrant protein 1-like [Sphaeramia orbicularis]|uniref:tip elongation aberrant protein 1-like n=1 Tax=Sphaeramia orbicularis TaxID=375764 RepID=UPI001181265B|nr:tip elongation aberrant protein 1-like [Sphaeramia orbicularis]